MASKAATALPSAAETLVNAAANAAASGGGGAVGSAAAKAEEQKEALLESLGGQGQQGVAAAKGSGSGAWKGKNVILFLSDQESPLLHVPNPQEWERQNLPGVTRLKKNGVEFKRAYSNACMCTAARATLFTGFLTTQTNARYVLEQPMPSTLYPQIDTPSDLPNLATAAKAAGFEEGVVYKGKLHLTKPRDQEDYSWSSTDALKYGFSRWNYPDAGSNQSLSESGGSPAFNDKRFMESVGPESEGKEGVFQFLRERAASRPSSPIGNSKKPFFLVISLVNPHDVLFYPLQFAASGYPESMLTGDVQLPPTYAESLLTKPRAQREWVASNIGAFVFSLFFFPPSSSSSSFGRRLTRRHRVPHHDHRRTASGVAPRNVSEAVKYLNFYANLVKETDSYLDQTLSLLDELGLTNDTVVIKTADHGEMAMSHGGQIQKMFNFYEESARVVSSGRKMRARYKG